MSVGRLRRGGPRVVVAVAAAVVLASCGPSEQERVAAAYCERIEAEYERAGMLDAAGELDPDADASDLDQDVYFVTPVPDAIVEDLVVLSGEGATADQLRDDPEPFVEAAERVSAFLREECGFDLA